MWRTSAGLHVHRGEPESNRERGDNREQRERRHRDQRRGTPAAIPQYSSIAISTTPAIAKSTRPDEHRRQRQDQSWKGHLPQRVRVVHEAVARLRERVREQLPRQKGAQREHGIWAAAGRNPASRPKKILNTTMVMHRLQHRPRRHPGASAGT